MWPIHTCAKQCMAITSMQLISKKIVLILKMQENRQLQEGEAILKCNMMQTAAKSQVRAPTIPTHTYFPKRYKLQKSNKKLVKLAFKSSLNKYVYQSTISMGSLYIPTANPEF